MFDTWNLVGIGGGSAALTWLAAGPHANQQNTLRLSLDKGNSLLGDVRFLGGVLTAVASMYTKGRTKKVLQTATAAMALSLVQTEVVRWQQVKQGTPVKKDLPFAPNFSYGALPGPAANNAYHTAPQGQWAGRR